MESIRFRESADYPLMFRYRQVDELHRFRLTKIQPDILHCNKNHVMLQPHNFAVIDNSWEKSR
jgi:hypothetical protein